MPMLLTGLLSFLGKYWWEVLIAIVIGSLILVVKIDHYEIIKLKATLVTVSANLADANKAISAQNKATEDNAKQTKANQDSMDQLNKTLQQRSKDQAAIIDKLQKAPVPTDRLKYLQDGLQEINQW